MTPRRAAGLDYHDGERNPHVTRDESKRELLGAIGAPRAEATPSPR
jgi:hypothetical protein